MFEYLNVLDASVAGGIIFHSLWASVSPHPNCDRSKTCFYSCNAEVRQVNKLK